MKLYNESDCQEISKKVLEKKDYFKRRYNGMFTLGAASYLDASKYSPETTYLTDEEITNRLTKYNTLLQETFPELLETIRCFFEKELKWVRYKAIIFGSVGNGLNPFLTQKLEKSLKSA